MTHCNLGLVDLAVRKFKLLLIFLASIDSSLTGEEQEVAHLHFCIRSWDFCRFAEDAAGIISRCGHNISAITPRCRSSGWIRSVDRSLAGGGFTGSKVKKMEYYTMPENCTSSSLDPTGLIRSAYKFKNRPVRLPGRTSCHCWQFVAIVEYKNTRVSPTPHATSSLRTHPTRATPASCDATCKLLGPFKFRSPYHLLPTAFPQTLLFGVNGRTAAAKRSSLSPARESCDRRHDRGIPPRPLRPDAGGHGGGPDGSDAGAGAVQPGSGAGGLHRVPPPDGVPLVGGLRGGGRVGAVVDIQVRDREAPTGCGPAGAGADEAGEQSEGHEGALRAANPAGDAEGRRRGAGFLSSSWSAPMAVECLAWLVGLCFVTDLIKKGCSSECLSWSAHSPFSGPPQLSSVSLERPRRRLNSRQSRICHVAKNFRSRGGRLGDSGDGGSFAYAAVV
ncbi:hypothetical protein ACLOJK_033948 [Asimina triloba]